MKSQSHHPLAHRAAGAARSPTANAPSTVKNPPTASSTVAAYGQPTAQPAMTCEEGNKSDQHRDTQARVERPTERTQTAKHHQRNRTQQQRGEEAHPLQVLHAAGLTVSRLQQPAIDRTRMRRAELQHLAGLFVRLAQVRIIVAQTVVVKSSRPVSHAAARGTGWPSAAIPAGRRSYAVWSPRRHRYTQSGSRRRAR